MAKTTTTKRTTTSKRPAAKAANHGLGTTIDLVAAVLIVSLLINLFLVCLWVTLRVTTQYDAALGQFFLGR